MHSPLSHSNISNNRQNHVVMGLDISEEQKLDHHHDSCSIIIIIIYSFVFG
jgi:hypothetical protein